MTTCKSNFKRMLYVLHILLFLRHVICMQNLSYDVCVSVVGSGGFSTYGCAWCIKSLSELRQIQGAALSHPHRQRDRQLWLSAVRIYNVYLSAMGRTLLGRLTKNNPMTGGGPWWVGLGRLCWEMQLGRRVKITTERKKNECESMKWWREELKNRVTDTARETGEKKWVKWLTSNAF